MTPIKFDENIKEKLDKRILQPSSEAWNKLSGRLDSSESKPTNKAYWWIGIAASVVGVLFITSQFLSDLPKQIITLEIVNTPEVIEDDSNSSIINQEIEKVKPSVKESLANSEVRETPSLKQSDIDAESNNKVEVAITQANQAPIRTFEKDIPKDTILKKLTFEEQKIQDVVAQIDLLKQDNVEVTDETIDALLYEAQKEIALNKLINKSTGIVDANLLLQDVEAEVDQSFRSKVFEALQKSYNSVKTAVANRNE
ncbi:hypothetical protein [uncultured Algibacter sp.]|uniref:hypothetical protein n=1 Tax=uncultured Algibacter sp. TaxID=298659 RepID=UPI002632A269|nr:hypothetical protein [uncultured Algibacter sp.]